MKVIEQGTSPFNYWLVQNPIDPTLAQVIFDELSVLGNDPHYRARMWRYDNIFEKKFAQDNLELLPDVTRVYLHWTLSSSFIKKMEEISGIKGLIADPFFVGGGFHLHLKGGILKPHKDFTMHRSLKVIRRLNFIIYLNKNYEKSWGGELEFWKPDMSECEVKIEPGYNVGVLFETPNNPHGFSVPWDAPEGITRKSLAVYLYTSPTSEDLAMEHKSTQFLRAPNEEIVPEIEELREKRNHGRLNDR